MCFNTVNAPCSCLWAVKSLVRKLWDKQEESLTCLVIGDSTGHPGEDIPESLNIGEHAIDY